jgi:hypothetical protein
MVVSQPQPGTTSGFHVAMRGDRRHTSTNRRRLLLSFRPLGELQTQPLTRWCHIVFCTDRRSQLIDPQRQDHQWRHTRQQPPRRIGPPQSRMKSPITLSTASGLYQVHRSPVDRHRTDSLLPTSSSTPRCETAQLAAPRISGLLPYTSYPKTTIVGVPAATIEHSTPVPSPTATRYSHQLLGCSIFSKIDLLRTYNQIPFHPDDI